MKKENLINGQKPEFGNLEQIKILQNEERERREAKEAIEFYKNMTPDERSFHAMVNVDMAMCSISEMVKELSDYFQKRSPIDIMIDKATGYGKGKIKTLMLKLKEAYEFVIPEMKLAGYKDMATEHTALLEKINTELKGEYKKVKAA